MVAFYLAAAIRACENEIQSPILDSVFEIHLKCWQNPVNLFKDNVTAVNSVKYYDQDGALQTVASANFRSLTFESPARVEFDADYNFPSLDDREFPVTINFNAGFSASASIPETIQHAILLETADRYENRQNEAAGITVAMFSSNAKSILNSETLWL